jgi:signal peptidase I
MNEGQDNSKEARKSGSEPRRTLQRLLLFLALAMLIRRWVWMPTLVTGDSMLPTIQTGEIVGVNKLIYLFQPPRRGDVVAVWTGTELMIKRVVGLPGEEVAERDGVFYVDGVPLAEPYVQFRAHGNIAPGRVGLDRFVVAGDNRLQTLIAVINRERIIGQLRPRRGAKQTAVPSQLPHAATWNSTHALQPPSCYPGSRLLQEFSRLVTFSRYEKTSRNRKPRRWGLDSKPLGDGYGADGFVLCKVPPTTPRLQELGRMLWPYILRSSRPECGDYWFNPPYRC